MKLTQYLFIGVIAFICFPTMAADHSKDNEALNHLYTQFSLAFKQLDASVFEQVYAIDACYIPEQQGKEITMGRENIVALYSKFFGKIKHKKATIEVDFRVIERQFDSQSATDVGYYLVRFYPAKDTEEPMSEFAGKFVNVANKDSEGQWHLRVDTSNRSEPTFYFKAKPSPNLYYGSQFAPVQSE
ncbi:DUF4440 domain-containing protein [Shewanella sp. Isolate11]|uniref:YybH family protein n=1 Tax=Shewanella sp. Isolate11 TaxID=2908530 RepID=UPI001EFDA475|nr:DUF4440 domain-containing protein [Shewanella sp. Isolate11]MCG9696594.1 DUF4440 domain-containing protein [Shewanella sp. Isolate11]